jgi:Flp pilus assembly protein TadG
MKRRLLRRIVAFLSDCTGVNMLEAAVITPLLLLLSFAVVDFASIFYVYLALENGVSQATRLAVTGRTLDDPLNPGTPLSRAESIKLAMRQATPTLTIPDGDFSFYFMPVGGSSFSSGVGGPGDIGKVTVNYTWNVMTPMLRPFFTNGQIVFTVESAMKNESF